MKWVKEGKVHGKGGRCSQNKLFGMSLKNFEETLAGNSCNWY